MFKGLKERLREKSIQRKEEKQLYKETLQEERAKRRPVALKQRAKARAVREAKNIRTGRGKVDMSRIGKGFEKFGNDFLANIDPNPIGASGYGMSAFPQDPLDTGVRSAPHKKKKSKQKTIVIKV